MGQTTRSNVSMYKIKHDFVYPQGNNNRGFIYPLKHSGYFMYRQV
jgi:hypothetical protein